MDKRPHHESVLILVKALPRGGKIHGETVCCAGVTPELEWRRQYPIRFRYLKENIFVRWQWIEYDFRTASDDKRPESRRVQENTIVPGKILPINQRMNFLSKIILPSVEVAAQCDQTLALIRPRETQFKWRRKSSQEIGVERQDYKKAASQTSLFDDDKNPLEPCPFEFSFAYKSEDGKRHEGVCHDWETSAMFRRLNKRDGEEAALEKMNNVFNEVYPKSGMVLAMGTHSRWPDQWLINGVIRLDESAQLPLI